MKEAIFAVLELLFVTIIIFPHIPTDNLQLIQQTVNQSLELMLVVGIEVLAFREELLQLVGFFIVAWKVMCG